MTGEFSSDDRLPSDGLDFAGGAAQASDDNNDDDQNDDLKKYYCASASYSHLTHPTDPLSLHERKAYEACRVRRYVARTATTTQRLPATGVSCTAGTEKSDRAIFEQGKEGR